MDDEEILGLFEQSEDPVLFTREVADALDFTRTGAQKRLDQLVEQGYLESKQYKARVYWLTRKGRESAKLNNS